jgi:hypothetical protein
MIQVIFYEIVDYFYLKVDTGVVYQNQ